MDGKKQTNLTPELKEIYDRVMNTSAAPKPAASPQSPSSPLASPTPPPTPASPTTPPPTSEPTMAPLGASPTTSPPGIGMPNTNTAEEALTSSPPRPVSQVDGTKPFSFSGTASSTPATKDTSAKSLKKPVISMPILIVLGIAFVAVWAVFWLVILGFISR